MKKVLIVICLIASSGLLAFQINNAPAEVWNVTTIAGWEEDNNTMDGQGTKAHFTWQMGASAIDAADNYYVIDQVCIRKWVLRMRMGTAFPYRSHRGKTEL